MPWHVGKGGAHVDNASVVLLAAVASAVCCMQHSSTRLGDEHQ